MPTVTVIVPLYNKVSYVRRALDSVLAQTFDDFECVVVDDGSTDEGPEIVKSYSDPRIRLVRQANAGPAAARNRGVKESTAPWVAFLDADDEWLPDFLRMSIEALANHPECMVSVTSHYEGPSRNDLTPFFSRSGLCTGVWLLSADADAEDLERGRSVFMMGAVVCQRHVFERYGGFYDRKRVICGEDTYLWLQLLVNCKIFMILQPLVWYHHEASVLGRRWTKAGVLQPYYSAYGLLRKNCPREHQHILDEHLARCAARRVSELCRHRDAATAKQVLAAFPSLRHTPWLHAKLRMMTMFPYAYCLLRTTRALTAVGKERVFRARTDLYAPERPPR